MCVQCEIGADECVSAGIKWLDQHGPANWRDKLNTDLLDIKDTRYCVLGQLYGDSREDIDGYHYAVEHFFGGVFDDDVTGPLGFSNYENLSCEDMTDAWKRALTA